MVNTPHLHEAGPIGTWANAPTMSVDVAGTSFAYRQLGPKAGVPVIMLNHWGAVLDNFDPRIVDGLAAGRPVIAIDYRGVGASGGKAPLTVSEMAEDTSNRFWMPASDCVAFDLPAHGQSPGHRLNLPMGASAVLVVGDALGPFTGIVTHSFGGLIAALAIEGGAPMTRKLHVERLVLISSPNSLAHLTQNFADIQRFSPRTLKAMNEEIERLCGRTVHELNAGNFLHAAGAPTLVIHDEQDEEVPISEAGAILARAGSTVNLMSTIGLGHRRIVVMPNVVRAAVRHLSS